MTRFTDSRLPSFDKILIAFITADGLLALLAIQAAEDSRTFIFLHVGFVALSACLLAAIYYTRFVQVDSPVSWRKLILLLCALLMLSLVLDLSGTTLADDALAILHRRFRQPYWQAFGLALATLVFLPIIYKSLRRGLGERRYADLAVCAGFLFLVSLLYMPTGFDSIAHWENWIYLAHLEGRESWSIAYEMITRFWVAVPHQLGAIISPDSFFGFHLTHLLILWGKLALLYGILRKLGFPGLYAFLATVLVFYYPVNSDLLSLRSLPNQFSALALLAAGYLILDFRQHPNRLHLLGIWLALSFNVASNETAYALIGAAALLWLFANRPPDWSSMNLAAIWLLAPLAKLAYLALLAGKSLTFYNSYVFSGNWNADSDGVAPILSRLADVYRHTFVDSWLDSVWQLSQSNWLVLCAIVIALAAGIAWLLARTNRQQTLPSNQALAQFTAGGILFIIPSVGILIWLEQYSGDLWRTYFYAPIGAGVALFSLIALVTAPIKHRTHRHTAIVVLCLAACAPGIARLFEQQEQLVASADNKATLLRNLLHVAPHIEPDTVLVLLSDLPLEALDATDYYELRYSRELDDSILYILYGSDAPLRSHFCLEVAPCSHLKVVTDIVAPDWTAEALQRTLFLKLNRDLTVQLIDDPLDYFDIDIDIPYDASQLYKADAPLPPRADAMLGPAIRR